jgi:beta-lactamase class A
MSARFAVLHHEDTKNTKGAKTSLYDTKMSLYNAAFVGFVVLRFSVMIVAAQPPATAAELKSKLEHRIEDIAAHVDGVVGYEVLDLTSGERFGHLEREVFPTASTIKLAIVYELFKQADEGRVALDDRITLDRRQAVGGSGVLHELGTPTLSIRDYAALMVTLSDNTATNVLIDRVGIENVTKRMQGLGLASTKLRRHMMDLAAARRGDENVSTPADVVRLLQIVNAGDGLAPASRDAALALLEKAKVSRLRQGLPPGVAAADKPGELEGVRVDAGIVFAKNRPYALCVMATYLKNEEEGERAIVDISRAAYEYFSRIGAGGMYGRKIYN